MNRFKHWLFCTLFPDEAGTLMRYRLNIDQLDRWFCGHVPAVADATRWLKHYSEAKDDPNDPPSGLDISGLRAKLMAADALRLPRTPTKPVRPLRISAGEYLSAVRFLREIECDLDGAEIDAFLRLFGLSLMP